MQHIKHTKLVSSDDHDNEGCAISYFENILSPQDAAATLRELEQELPWKVETDNFGLQSRPTAYLANSRDCIFTYVGLRLEPNLESWSTPTLQRLRTSVTTACDLSQGDLTACLANLYPQGSGHIPWHFDEVRAHGTENIVATLSLGGPRIFQWRRRQQAEHAVGSDSNQTTIPRLQAHSIVLQPGSVLLMSGRTQQYYEHCLPLAEELNVSNEDKDDGMKSRNPLRISLTFRSIVPGYEDHQTNIATDSCCMERPEYCQN